MLLRPKPNFMILLRPKGSCSKSSPLLKLQDEAAFKDWDVFLRVLAQQFLSASSTLSFLTDSELISN